MHQLHNQSATYNLDIPVQYIIVTATLVTSSFLVSACYVSLSHILTTQRQWNSLAIQQSYPGSPLGLLRGPIHFDLWLISAVSACHQGKIIMGLVQNVYSTFETGSQSRTLFVRIVILFPQVICKLNRIVQPVPCEVFPLYFHFSKIS